MTRAHSILLLALAGCSASDPQGFERVVPHVFNPNELALVFSPGLGAEDIVREAVTLLNETTQAGFSVGPEGIPVELFDQVRSPEVPGMIPEHRCGQTPIYYQWDDARQSFTRDIEGYTVFDIDIQITYPPTDECWSDPARTLVHEMIHALRRKWVTPVKPPFEFAADDHTKTGVFQGYADPGWDIDEASLMKICQVIECKVFNPELL